MARFRSPRRGAAQRGGARGLAGSRAGEDHAVATRTQKGDRGAVEDLVVHDRCPGAGGQGLTGAGAAGEAGERSAADLHAQPVSAPEPVRGREELHRHSAHPGAVGGNCSGVIVRLPSQTLVETPCWSTSHSRTNTSPCSPASRTAICADTGPITSSGTGRAGRPVHARERLRRPAAAATPVRRWAAATPGSPATPRRPVPARVRDKDVAQSRRLRLDGRAVPDVPR